MTENGLFFEKLGIDDCTFGVAFCKQKYLKKSIFSHGFLPNDFQPGAGIRFACLNLSFLQILKFTGHKILYYIENLHTICDSVGGRHFGPIYWQVSYRISKNCTRQKSHEFYLASFVISFMTNSLHISTRNQRN